MTPPHIFIAGPSASGKSTVAKLAGELLSRQVICLDDFFLPRIRRWVTLPTGKVRDYEHPSLYDGAALARRITASRAPLIVEGFCLFQYPEIIAIPAARFFLPTPFATCLARRRARTPRRPSDTSFELIGEASTAQWITPQASLPGVHILPADLAPDQLAQHILRFAG